MAIVQANSDDVGKRVVTQAQIFSLVVIVLYLLAFLKEIWILKCSHLVIS